MTVRMTMNEGLATLAVAGRFDFNAHKEFRKCSEDALALPGLKAIEVDLRDVEYLDSSALGMLLLLREKAQGTAHCEVSLSGCRGLVQQILEVANFSRLFKITQA